MEEIKQRLLEIQASIINDIEQDRDKSVNSISGDIGDDIDYATEDRHRELYQIFCERDQKKLKRIEHALELIEAKSYGICEECGEKIGKKRLMALPFTELCIDCKNEEERLKGIDRVPDKLSKYSGSDSGEL